MTNISIIVAVDQNGGFAKNGNIPWLNEPFAKVDFKHFQKVTKKSVCIMGRRTYENMVKIQTSKNKKIGKSILPGRQCYVLSRNSKYKAKGAIVMPELRAVFDDLKKDDNRNIFILGGEKLFIQILPTTTTVYMTIINNDYNCDKLFQLDYLTKYFYIKDGKQTDDLSFVTYVHI